METKTAEAMLTVIYSIIGMIGVSILSCCMIYALDVGGLKVWLSLPTKRRVVAAIGFAALFPLWAGIKVVDFFTGGNTFKD